MCRKNKIPLLFMFSWKLGTGEFLLLTIFRDRQTRRNIIGREKKRMFADGAQVCPTLSVVEGPANLPLADRLAFASGRCC